MKIYKYPLFLIFASLGHIAYAQSISVKEEIRSLDTYGFGKPDPAPILAKNPKIFPYFKFEEYEKTSRKKDWKVVTLENDYIKVMVLPEIGGKIWGAIEKSTGEEFLYKNEVVKFRNIAMRGPWTSGGVEFNFGIIGHHPATATPVDYLTRTYDDGSVSCIVGGTDLPSNTRWTVEIRLEKDKAYFGTDVSWYNASQLTESYYNWMTAAAVATDDLEFFIPGNTYLEHNGNAHTWPIDDQDRKLSLYKNNDFGPAKSYHIVGEYNDFFGGYYHDRQFGFGQWAPYEEMPGQKLWLWALSRSGGIWEDLLTDSDGQYIEFQAGRLFDQYSAGAVNPISQVGFDPNMMDQWGEIWFPYKNIGGMVDASQHGVLNVEIDGDQMTIGLNALQKLDQRIMVLINGKSVLSEKLNLGPMDVFTKSIPIKAVDSIKVFVEDTELSYISNSMANQLKRPFYSDEKLQVSPTQMLLAEGTEAMQFRDYGLALEKLSELVAIDPSHRTGLTQLAELEYRRTNYSTALAYANTVLKMDTYDSGANYIAGIAYGALKDTINALESLGWAARDAKYRSVAFAQMAELYLASKNYDRAETYARKALDFNTYNINARKILVISARKKEDKAKFDKEIKTLKSMAPLDYFPKLEIQFTEGINPILDQTNEFPMETLLGLAVEYYRWGHIEEAIQLLDIDIPKKGNQFVSNPIKNILWKAFLIRDKDAIQSKKLLEEANASPVDFVFPYRRETIPVLEWAVAQTDSWKTEYYLAQNYLAVGLYEKGVALLKSLGEEPNSSIFYRFRGRVMEEDYMAATKDLEKALELQPGDWKVWEEYLQFLFDNNKYSEAGSLSKKAYTKFPDNYNIALAHARYLLNTAQYEKVISVLENVEVLPFEHASESRNIYERSYTAAAQSQLERKNYKKAIVLLEKSKQWPENIGVGKPYNPDERKQDYLLALALDKTGHTDRGRTLLESIVDYTKKHLEKHSFDHLYGLLAMEKLEKQQEATQLYTRIKQSGTELDTPLDLALTIFESNKEGQKQTDPTDIIPKDAYEIALWAVQQ